MAAEVEQGWKKDWSRICCYTIVGYIYWMNQNILSDWLIDVVDISSLAWLLCMGLFSFSMPKEHLRSADRTTWTNLRCT